MVRTLEAAAAWIDDVGLALVFPKADVVLPSLWEQVNGSPSGQWAVRDADGRVRALDRGDGVPLGREGRAAGCRASPASASMSRGSRRASRLGSCRCSSAAVEPKEPSADEQTVVAAITGEGPLTGPQLRDLTGLPKRELDRRRRRAAPQARRHERVSRRAGRPVGRDRTRPRRAQVGGCLRPARARRCAPPPARSSCSTGRESSRQPISPGRSGGAGARQRTARQRRQEPRGRRLPHLGPELDCRCDDRGAGGRPGRRGRVRRAPEAQAAHEVRRFVPRARARRPDRPHRGPGLERRRASRRAVRRGRCRARARPRREVPRPPAARRALARSVGRRPGVADSGDPARRATSWRDSSSFSSPS